MKHLTTRRAFLRSTSAFMAMTPIAGLATTSVGQARQRPAAERAANETIVLIRLAGGNDGLNTVIPLADPAYARARPTLAVDRARALPIDRTIGLHPAMTRFKTWFDAGKLAVVQGVGAAELPRDHADAARLWRQDKGQAGETRWLGWPIADDLAAVDEWPVRFARVAAGIRSSVLTKVHAINLAGFDTHSGQNARHAFLLGRLNDALGDFRSQIASQGDGQRVTILIYSEFGRQVQENATGGTDHGSAGPVFVIGNAVRGGVIGSHPSLTDLDGGGLKHGTDFRSIYAGLLTDPLGIAAADRVDPHFPAVAVIRARA